MSSSGIPASIGLFEVQSHTYHHSLLDQQRDHERLARLRAEGWILLEVSDADVWHHPERVVLAVRDALRSARTTRTTGPRAEHPQAS